MKRLTILLVTPEITFLPRGMGNLSNVLAAKSGGLADISSALVNEFFNQGLDIHVTLPHYRRLFNIEPHRMSSEEFRFYYAQLDKHDDRIHLAEDRSFLYMRQVYSNDVQVAIKQALAFQREVINHVIRQVMPDVIHCNDWMTGLVPAFARRLKIRSLFTVHNIHSERATLEHIENEGVDGAAFWQHLYYQYPPVSYEESRGRNPVDFLASGLFAAHAINTVSPTFLKEIVDGWHGFIKPNIRSEICNKYQANLAYGVLNAPDNSYNPASDPAIKELNYSAETENVLAVKRQIKLRLQEKLGLDLDPQATLLFWPSRLDPMQKGCQLLTDILYHLIDKYYPRNLQLVVVANGPYQGVLHHIAWMHQLHHRIAVMNFEESLSRQSYAASDFVLMPSVFEPCGLSQMVAQRYGSLPIVMNTGGLHDTVTHLDPHEGSGSGFIFNDWDSGGLLWAIDRAMEFQLLPEELRNQNIRRVMAWSLQTFNITNVVYNYIHIYEEIMRRRF